MVNYGGLGAIIGREITHGFNEQGNCNYLLSELKGFHQGTSDSKYFCHIASEKQLERAHKMI